MIRRIQAWLDYVGARAAVEEIGSFSNTLVITIFTALTFVLMTTLPGAHEAFHLQLGPAIAAYVPRPILAIGGGLLRPRVTRRQFVLYTVVAEGIVGCFPALLIAFSRPPGSLLFAAFFVVTAFAHGQYCRISPRFPYFAFVIVA